MYSWHLFNNDSTTRPIDTIKDASFSEYEELRKWSNFNLE